MHLSSLVLWEYLEYIATAIVLIGVAGEFLADFEYFPKRGKDPQRRFSKRFALVLIAGLALEILGTVRTSQLSNREIARLNKEAGDARKEAADAMEGAADATERAARLEAQAEQERHARVKIEEQMNLYAIPRTVSAKQAADVSAYLAKHEPRAVVTIKVYPGDEEASEYAGELFNAIRGGQWEVRMDTSLPATSTFSGLCLYVEEPSHPQNPDPTRHLHNTQVDRLEVRVRIGWAYTPIGTAYPTGLQSGTGVDA